MSFIVRYGDRVIDLHQATDADLALIAELHKGKPWRQDRDVLQCLETGGDRAMHIRWVEARGRYYFAHFSGGAHGSHEVVPESDAHKRMKDYTARAATDAGYTATQEFRIPRGRLDVAVTGGLVDVGIESQLSEKTSRYFKARTTVYRNAGYLTAWFSDQRSVPPYLAEVPAFGSNPLRWDEYLPPPRTAAALGLTAVEAVKCDAAIGAFDRCPDGKRRACGKYHPKRSPWLGLYVDDVAARLPAGEIVPLASRDGRTYLVSPGDLALYGELTNGLGEWAPGRARKPGKPAQEPGPCANPRHDEPEPAVTLPEPRTAPLEPPTAARRSPWQCITCGAPTHIRDIRCAACVAASPPVPEPQDAGPPAALPEPPPGIRGFPWRCVDCGTPTLIRELRCAPCNDAKLAEIDRYLFRPAGTQPCMVIGCRSAGTVPAGDRWPRPNGWYCDEHKPEGQQ